MSKIHRLCETCSRPFDRFPSQDGPFCSRKCAGRVGNAVRIANMLATVIKRFWERVPHRPEEGCWEWLGGKTGDGYGSLSVGAKRVLAHRYSYYLSFGDPGDALVCHTCDNPSCVRPSHLFLGDHQANSDDMQSKNRGRWFSGEKNQNAKLLDAQVEDLLQLYRAGVRQTDLAVRFGISQPHVSRLIRKGEVRQCRTP